MALLSTKLTGESGGKGPFPLVASKHLSWANMTDDRDFFVINFHPSLYAYLVYSILRGHSTTTARVTNNATETHYDIRKHCIESKDRKRKEKEKIKASDRLSQFRANLSLAAR